MSQKCPSCEQPASGRFCSNCGAQLGEGGSCAECSAALAAGARFCSNCGTPAGAGTPAGVTSAARAVSNLPWFVAGVAVVSLIAIGVVPRLRSEPMAQGIPMASAPAAPAAPGAGMGGVDLASMTPREAADRLFDRVMRSVSAGDSAQARMFLPMALDAYRMAGDLDADARYHLGVLHLVNGDPASARAEADAVLAADPTHLFGLFVAAQAEQDRGNASAARELYRRFQEVYPAEVERNLPEYQAHMQALPGMRAEAQAFISSGP